MSQSNRKLVSLQTQAYGLAVRLRDALTKRSGKKFTLGDVIERALRCLQDSHERGAWLSPREAAPLLEQRNRERMAAVLAEFVARVLPDRRLKSVRFDPSSETMLVYLDDRTIPLFLGGVKEADDEQPVN